MEYMIMMAIGLGAIVLGICGIISIAWFFLGICGSSSSGSSDSSKKKPDYRYTPPANVQQKQQAYNNYYAEQARRQQQQQHAPQPAAPQRAAQPVKTFDQMLQELRDERDNATAVDTNVDREMKMTTEVVRRVRINAQTNLNLGIDDLTRKVTDLVDYAEKISGNANPAYFKKGSDNFVYNEHLWYRARLAGVAFKEASQLVQAKLNELHEIDFGTISSGDRQKIMQLQSADGLVALKNALLNNAITMFSINKNIKELIRVHCGEGGRLWAEKMDKSGEGKR